MNVTKSMNMTITLRCKQQLSDYRYPAEPQLTARDNPAEPQLTALKDPAELFVDRPRF